MQACAKEFLYIMVNRVKNFKSAYFNVFVLNWIIMKLTRVIQIYKNILPLKIVLIVLNFHVQDFTKYCGHIMFYIFKRLEEYFQLNYKNFLALLILLINNVYAYNLSACPSIRTLSNSRKYSSNVLKFLYVIHIWYKINRIENAWKKCMGWNARLQRLAKIFRNITAYGGGRIFKAYFNVCILHLIYIC